MLETMHRLHIADPRKFYRLPEQWRLLHMAHVKNSLSGKYAPSDATRKPVDAQDLMASQIAFKHAPPSQQVIDNARMLLNVPGIHPLLRRDAEETLHRAGLTA